MVFRCNDGSIDWIMSGIMTVITAIVIFNFLQTGKTASEAAELKIEVANMKAGISEIRDDVKYLVREKREEGK